ncbi:hypothetical protein KR222_000127, partial [Zaprionus bogoriensis]
LVSPRSLLSLAVANFCYVVSQKGRTLLLHEGYYYVREKALNNKTYWRCTQYTTLLRCHGRIHTMFGRIIHHCKHNHKFDESGRGLRVRP